MSAWTEERIETLKRMWAEDATGSQIGVALGMTRSAVLGKAMRLKLPKKSEDTNNFNRRRALVKAKPPKKAAAPKAARPKVNVHPGNIVRSFAARAHDPGLKALPKGERTFPNAKHWTERKFGECAFPVGSGADTQSCCEPTERTYCKDCEAVMFNPVQPKKRDTARLARWAA